MSCRMKPYSLPFGCSAENLPERHAAGFLKRDEGNRVRIDAPVVDGPGDYGRPIESYRNRAAFPAEVPRELFLGLDEILQHRVGDGDAFRHETGEIRSHLANALLHFHPILRVPAFVEWHEKLVFGNGFHPMGFKLPGKPGGGP